jgi:hypothetical protein
MSAREKDSADFDLEAFIDLFDEALTSDDPSVQKTLQHLMVITALARSHAGHHDRGQGPMRRMYQDLYDINRRLKRLELDQESRKVYPGGGTPMPGTIPLGPYYPPTTIGPNTGSPWPSNPGTIPPFPPGTIWGQSTNSTLDPGYGAVPPLTATQVNDFLKDEKYKGSSVGANDK